MIVSENSNDDASVPSQSPDNGRLADENDLNQGQDSDNALWMTWYSHTQNQLRYIVAYSYEVFVNPLLEFRKQEITVDLYGVQMTLNAKLLNDY